MRKWQRYTPGVQDQALERLKGCTNVEALARELNVSRGNPLSVAGQAGGQAAGLETAGTGSGHASDRRSEERSGSAKGGSGG